eukprot:6360882-Pyramimonas_sp.AAC.1
MSTIRNERRVPFRRVSLFWASCEALVATAGSASTFQSERTPGEARGVISSVDAFWCPQGAHASALESEEDKT